MIKWTFSGQFDTRGITIPAVVLLGVVYGDWLWAVLGVLAGTAYLRLKWK